MPFNWFVILNFGLVFVLSIIYAYSVNSRVERWDKPTTTTNDGELQPLSQESQTSQPDEHGTKSRRVFYIYLLHLVFFRLVPMILFVILVLYPADFPTKFSCPWPSGTSSNVNITDNTKRFNLTIVDCTNPSGSKSATLAEAVWIVDIIFALVTFVEAVYLVWRNCKDKYFTYDLEFCSVYLLGKKKTIRKTKRNYRKELASDQEMFKLDILSLQKGTIDEMYVKLIIQKGRENKKLHDGLKRHEIYKAYLEPSNQSILVEKLKICSILMRNVIIKFLLLAVQVLERP